MNAQNPKLKFAVMMALLFGIAAAVTFLIVTPTGHVILQDPRRLGHAVRRWQIAHHLIAPLAFVGIYVLLGILALPVWWLQLLCGYSFGIVPGVILSQIGATLAAVSAAAISRFLLGDWFRMRVESHVARLEKFDESLGRNGFFVVCAVRLVHFFPAGVSNYVLGLTRISLRDIGVGTALGGLPTATTWVLLGSGAHPLSDWRYLLGLGALNGVLLVPMIVRYIRPDWFRRFGIE